MRLLFYLGVLRRPVLYAFYRGCHTFVLVGLGNVWFHFVRGACVLPLLCVVVFDTFVSVVLHNLRCFGSLATCLGLGCVALCMVSLAGPIVVPPPWSCVGQRCLVPFIMESLRGRCSLPRSCRRCFACVRSLFVFGGRCRHMLPEAPRHCGLPLRALRARCATSERPALCRALFPAWAALTLAFESADIARRLVSATRASPMRNA